MGRGASPDPDRSRVETALTAFLDTNVLICHFTGDPPDLATHAIAALAGADQLLLADLVVAECVYVLESFYEVPRERVAELMRAAIALPSIRTVDPRSLLRAPEVYEVDRLDFAEAYLVAHAEATGVTRPALTGPYARWSAHSLHPPQPPFRWTLIRHQRQRPRCHNRHQSDQLSLPSRWPPHPSTPTTMKNANDTNPDRPLWPPIHLRLWLLSGRYLLRGIIGAGA